MFADLVKDGSVWAEEGVGDEPAGPVRPADVERLRQGGHFFYFFFTNIYFINAKI